MCEIRWGERLGRHAIHNAIIMIAGPLLFLPAALGFPTFVFVLAMAVATQLQAGLAARRGGDDTGADEGLIAVRMIASGIILAAGPTVWALLVVTQLSLGWVACLGSIQAQVG